MKVPFFEFRLNPAMRRELDAAHRRVMDRAIFISGPELRAFEEEAASFLGVSHVIGVGNGYDALFIALKSLSINGSASILLQSNAYPATINAVIHSGNVPVFCDIDPESNFFSDAAFRNLLEDVDVILPVYFFGSTNPGIQQSGTSKIVVEDFSQALGAGSGQNKCGRFGKINAASMYPTKSLGAFGDAGLITTNDTNLAEFCRQYRNYGEEKYNQLRHVGVNSRLDELQAAFLRVMLKYLPQHIEAKRKIAGQYFEELSGIEGLRLPARDFGNDIYHQFTIKTDKRDRLKDFLASEGIETKIHYPIPVFMQEAYRDLDFSGIDQKMLLQWHQSILSLPSFAGIRQEEVAYVCDRIKKFLN